ncbi:MAG TPA: cytochrome d ubiquinol oxidase subunit II [Acidimicrobiales bacterium]|jgi:cytochrome d ubiquinol oxidase subunit II|nr:cytochrome d ubiquinol oxidase subunit II [Acidimicrobiales bacterium]
MTLGEFWFIVVAVLWVGFFILEGFDFGVGMLHSFLGRTDIERRVLINTIGPVWDGNEVWLIVAGAAIFAAFPGWYATMFSALYLAVVLLLLALMVRGLTFEYQRKFDDPRWRTFWRWGMTVGSALIPFLIGVALGDLLHGLPINSQHEYTGGFWQLLTPFGLWMGLTMVALSLLMGATYLTLKTTGEIHARAQRAATGIAVVAVVVSFGFFTWVHVGLSTGFIPEPLEALALMAVIAAAWLTSARADGWAFAASAVGIAGTVGSIFTELFPRVMISTTNTAYNLTVQNTASPPYTLKVMTVVAVVLVPVVVVYQAWAYHVFRARLEAPKVGGEDESAAGVAVAGSGGASPGSPPRTA